MGCNQIHIILIRVMHAYSFVLLFPLQFAGDDLHEFALL